MVWWEVLAARDFRNEDCRTGGPELANGMDHHVYFWLKEEKNNAEDRGEFEKGLAALFEIGGIISGRWAIPAKVEQRPVVDQSWDYALTIQFETVEAHDVYQNHPDHQSFIGKFKDWWAQVQVKDLA